ncbi:hypothetical protein OPV22_008498 [Ensete ventricosum]|uniref:Pentacotripeptide-repeat region of PRORP domain-containing protein n=1 Tax=Ensete ventricosum TaxID=4639 RepID=A0AAV8RCW3_ENSVE|nr:hypothetical protein OPV22_008498 [Ensete ventricosum]RWW22849.1 hypothetical protein GW17_00012920 [Ensete ventricosum]RWW56823.1 hypothetical protein BHE74_00036438 [Ensete ventricosum]RZS20622.1 hypothetical protein BHM03_00053154 [Ensete ventricosum]
MMERSPLTLSTSRISSTAGAIWGKSHGRKICILADERCHIFAAPRKMEDGHELLKEMQQKGCEPHAVLYTALIQALTLFSGSCKSGKTTRGYEFLDAMMKQGLRPDSSAFFYMLAGHEVKEQLEESLELMSTMSKAGCLPDFSI